MVKKRRIHGTGKWLTVKVMMSERVQCRDNGEQRRPAGTNKLLGEKGDVLQSEIADDSLA